MIVVSASLQHYRHGGGRCNAHEPWGSPNRGIPPDAQISNARTRKKGRNTRVQSTISYKCKKHSQHVIIHIRHLYYKISRVFSKPVRSDEATTACAERTYNLQPRPVRRSDSAIHSGAKVLAVGERGPCSKQEDTFYSSEASTSAECVRAGACDFKLRPVVSPAVTRSSNTRTYTTRTTHHMLPTQTQNAIQSVNK